MLASMSEERPIGLGCMRVPEGAGGVAVLRAALEAGVTLFDTAASYGPEKEPHHNERQLAEALGERSAEVSIVTKAGMKRARGRWLPNGKRKTILADATRSAEALGRAPDVLMLHLPDPSGSISTSVRALASAQKGGLCRSVGLSNVTLAQLEEARSIAEVSMVEVAAGPFDEDAARGGVIERCRELGIPVLAHSPLGGPKKPRRLTDDADLRFLAESHGVTPQTIVLAWLRSLGLVPIPGASRIETARLAATAATLLLRDDERAILDERFALGRLLRTERSTRAVMKSRREVVLFVGVPAAGKTSAARELTDDGFLRLSRDERGGSLKQLADAMGDALDEGQERILMDATYPTRAGRSRVLEAAWERGARVRCIHFDTPIEEAQVNAVDRMLERAGELLAGDALKAAGKENPNLFPPHAQYRFRDRLEPPSPSEGFAAVEVRPFERRPVPGHDGAGVLIELAALVDTKRWQRGERIDPERLRSFLRPGVPTMVMAWLPEPGDEGRLEAELRAIDDTLEVSVCTHPPGPARCWCRPPLPGLAVAWLRHRKLAPAKVTFLAKTPIAERLAETLGLQLRPTSPG